MRYMLLIYGEETQQDDGAGDAPEISPPWMEYTGWLLREGIHTAGERLATASSANLRRPIQRCARLCHSS